MRHLCNGHGIATLRIPLDPNTGCHILKFTDTLGVISDLLSTEIVYIIDPTGQLNMRYRLLTSGIACLCQLGGIFLLL